MEPVKYSTREQNGREGHLEQGKPSQTRETYLVTLCQLNPDEGNRLELIVTLCQLNPGRLGKLT